VRLASWFGTDDPRRKRRASWFGTYDPRRERGAERADSGTARSEYLGVRRRCKGRVHPGAGYPAGLPRDSGHGMPWATTGQDVVSVTEEPIASVSMRSRPAESHRNRRQLCWNLSSQERALEGEIKGLRTPTASRGCTGTKGERPAA
jgi:hypothetical protein